jgi:hypothetical protein
MTSSVSSIKGNPAPEEVVAITVAVTALAEESAPPAPGPPAQPADWLNVWVEASRRSAQRSTLTRGPWRISGRLVRRSRI